MKPIVQINLRCPVEFGETLRKIADDESARAKRRVSYMEIIRNAVEQAYGSGSNGNGGTKKPAESSKKTQHNRGVMAAEEPPALALATEVPQLYVDGKKIPPDLNSVINFFQERGSTKDEAEHFYDHFQGNGWRVSKVAMKDWHAAARNWIRNAPAFKARTNGYNPDRTMDDIYEEMGQEVERMIKSGKYRVDERGQLVSCHQDASNSAYLYSA